jgi:DNA invertase Pin-like site-specific DNA recombinase
MGVSGEFRLSLRKYAPAVFRTGVVRDDGLSKQIGHQFRPRQRHLVHEQVDAGAVFDHVRVVACVAGYHSRMTLVINAVSVSRLDHVAMIDLESRHLHTIPLIDDAVFVELIGGDGDALRRKLFVDDTDGNIATVCLFEVGHQVLGAGRADQRTAVEAYLNGGRWKLEAEYVETESGKRADRPKLAAALAHAKTIGATVVFAKLDRLTRNVDLLRALVASDVDLVFCDLPHVPAGAMGRFLLTQMASVAELEAGLISERTKVALAAAKARGVKLGNPNGARALRGKQVGNRQAVAKVKANAEQRAANLMTIIDDVRAKGATSVRAIAAALNARGVLTPRGGEWHPTSTARVLARLSG